MKWSICGATSSGHTHPSLPNVMALFSRSDLLRPCKSSPCFNFPLMSLTLYMIVVQCSRKNSLHKLLLLVSHQTEKVSNPIAYLSVGEDGNQTRNHIHNNWSNILFDLQDNKSTSKSSSNNLGQQKECTKWQAAQMEATLLNAKIQVRSDKSTLTATSPIAQQALLATDTFSFASCPCCAPQMISLN
jgi:hypothetical protein